MDHNQTQAQAETFKGLVLKRTGLVRHELRCPREVSGMTPCVARDGAIAVADDVCVGCGAVLENLLEEERNKHDR